MFQTLLLRSRAAAFVKSLRTPVLKKKVSDVIKLSIGGTVVFVGINFYFKNEKFYDTWVMPIFHSVDPETAHNLAVMAAKYNLVPEAKLKESKLLEPPPTASIPAVNSSHGATGGV
ncbi:putative dihydroorotate dehydrogenase (quinone), mitochondrial [Penaeus vannamei]|uniref:Putative dihydroorotate dehydrogenase (Quinone), mitochondrial n=1 Tax=Penaeus vannamei TaxID=6689 RepID=A0A423T1A1_PENVA|nr:putative dihydroorotate dehydrogenase (quinone), mitochondrial [Penaeus vannamei]